MKNLTKAQANVYNTLRTLPASHRVHRTAGGLLRQEVLACYDGRTVGSLINRGLLEFVFSGDGFEVLGVRVN